MKILIFAGTSEGKALSSLLADQGHSLTVTVATDYGREVFEGFFQALENSSKIKLLEGRLNMEEISSLVRTHDLAFDATHPYATEVSKNIISACTADQKPYIRIIRESTIETESAIGSDHIYVKDQEEAIAFMNTIEEKVLLTTGSKDLFRYTRVNHYKERLYPRILPDMDSLKIAYDNGYKKSSIICMQGPFTSEVNAAMLKMTGAKYLLTKETGNSGGFLEKLTGCQMAEAQAIIIRRPREEMDTLQENDHNGSGADSNRLSISLSNLRRFLQRRMDDPTRLVQGEKESIAQPIKGALCQPYDFAIRDISVFLNHIKSDTTQADPMQAKELEKLESPQVTPIPQVTYRFPLFIALSGKTVTVIGSGRIAQRRIRVLLEYGAHVQVISPKAKEEIGFQHQNLRLINREYQLGDLEGALIVVAATGNREVNHQVGKEAEKLGIFASIADRKEESSFYFPALWTGKGLSVGMVGDGNDHRYMKQASDQVKAMLNHIDLRGI